METDEDHATMRESSSLVQNLLFTEYTDIFPVWCVGKYGWKTLESRCILIWFFGRNFWCPWHCKRCERTSFGTQYITVLLLNKVSHRPLKKWQGPCNCYSKHCQRHNGPEGWVLLTKVTSPYTNLDQIPKFKISTKYQLHDLTKPQQENTDQTLVSKFCLNLNFKLFTKPCAQSRDKI